MTHEDFESALGELLTKATDDSVKNVLGIFDKDKTVPQNIGKLKDGSSGVALQDTISFLKSNSPAYPVAQHVLSLKNRNKEEYSKDIAKFLDFVKPTQCLSCKVNYIPATEEGASNEPKCYLCHRPSHGICYKDTIIDPERGVIFVCTECLSVKAAKDLAADINNKKPEENVTKPATLDTPKSPVQQISEETAHKEVNSHQESEDCPLYLKRQCPHGLTGKREIDGHPCPYKHRRRCNYHVEYGPDGCRRGNKCYFLHPPYCQNSVKLKACLNRNCQELHVKGTQRHTRNLPVNPLQTITTSNRFPSWMAENSQENTSPNSQSQSRPDRMNPWKNNSQTPAEKQSPPQADPSNSRDFLERHLEGMKADLMSFIRTTITQAVPSIQPQYMMIQPASLSHQSQTSVAPAENRTNIQTAPLSQTTQTHAHQTANYQLQYPALMQPTQIPTC